MAIHWGSWADSGGNGMRLGYTISRSSVSHGSSSVTFTVNMYTENRYRYSDNNEYIHFGSKLGSNLSYDNHSSGGAVHRGTRSWTHSYSTYGTTARYTTGASVGYTYNGVHPSVTIVFNVPARPYGRPAAPTNATVSVDRSNNRTTVSWDTHSSGGAPYRSESVQHRVYNGNGDNTWSDYSYSANLNGTTSSYYSSPSSDNTIVQWRIRANNNAGSSSWCYSDHAAMKPAAPSDVHSRVSSSNNSILTTWVNNHYKSNQQSLDIQRSENGGAWSTVVSGLSSTTTSWTDSNPAAGKNRYRVRASREISSVHSSWTPGNTVSTIVPPDAPTDLIPTGVVDYTNLVNFRWQHNDGGDGADQSHFSIQYWNGSTWVYLVEGVASSVSRYTVPAGTFSNGGAVTYWRVQTQGNTSVGYGPWSSYVTTRGYTTPTVTLTAPPGTVNYLPLELTWEYQQDENLDESTWETQLSDSAGRLIDLHEESNSGTADEYDETLDDGASYIVYARAQDSKGQWSPWDRISFTVDMLPPAAVHLSATFDPDQGATNLNFTADEPVQGSTAGVDTINVQRRIGENGAWVTIMKNLPLDETAPLSVTDYVPSLRAANYYRANVTSLSPSKANTDSITVEAGTILHSFVSYGQVFDSSLRLTADPAISLKSGRTQAAKAMIGRKYPLLLQGKQLTRELAVSGVSYYGEEDADSAPEDWLNAPEQIGIACYRDPFGSRVFGMLSELEVQPPDQDLEEVSVSFKFTRVDYSEKPYVAEETQE